MLEIHVDGVEVHGEDVERLVEDFLGVKNDLAVGTNADDLIRDELLGRRELGEEEDLVQVPVELEILELDELVAGSIFVFRVAAVDETDMEVVVGGHGFEEVELDAPRIGESGGLVEGFLEAEVDVLELNLEVVDDFDGEPVDVALLLGGLFGFEVLLDDLLEGGELALELEGIVILPTRLWEGSDDDEYVLEGDLDGRGGKLVPGDFERHPAETAKLER